MTADAEDPLIPAIQAFERGDARRAREIALPLLQHESTTVRDRARALLDQTRHDPVITAVIALTAALVAILAAAYLGARH